MHKYLFYLIVYMRLVWYFVFDSIKHKYKYFLEFSNKNRKFLCNVACIQYLHLCAWKKGFVKHKSVLLNSEKKNCYSTVFARLFIQQIHIRSKFFIIITILLFYSQFYVRSRCVVITLLIFVSYLNVFNQYDFRLITVLPLNRNHFQQNSILLARVVVQFVLHYLCVK